MTSAPTFKMDDKKPISVKAPVKTTALGATTPSVTKPTKRIDLGAASNYGKSSDLGINSPTHRNTHSEDLFGSDESPTRTTSIKRNDIENIFDTADDFDPRAGEKKETADFGDFESAFGGKPTSALPLSSKSANTSSDFADFSSAFSPKQPAVPSLPSSLDDNFLFSPQSNISVAPPISLSASTSSDFNNADLFGNNVITSAFTSQPATAKNDLLDDFADLRINPSNQGEFKLVF